MAGGYHTDRARIAPNTENHIERIATGAGHMKVGLQKGCFRRCNGRVVPRPPGCRLFSQF